MLSRGAWVLAALVLLCAGSVAPAQTTQPVDSYQDRALPARRGATTQAAAGTVSTGGQGDFLDIKRVAVAMAIVLGTIYVSNRVWKKLGMPGAGNKASGSLQVVSRLAISPKQQILLIRVGRRLVLVGNCGTQMSALTEISDPEETAGIIGEAAVEQHESSTATFNDVLGGEEKQFDLETNVDAPPAQQQVETEGGALAATQEELRGLMDRVRGLSKQFRRE